MKDIKSAAKAAVEDVLRHRMVIVTSVTLAVLIRWMMWILIPLVLAAGVYTCWRRGVRIVKIEKD